MKKKIQQIMERPDAVGVNTLRDLIPFASESWFKQNWAFYLGDHWQQGEGWVGPQVAGTGLMADIERVFVSQNTIREIVERHVSGVGIPSWSIEDSTLPDEDEAERALDDFGEGDEAAEVEDLVAEAEGILRNWWDANQAVTTIVEPHDITNPWNAVLTALKCALLSKRGVLRWFIPEGLEGLVGSDIESVLNIIHLHVLHPRNGAVVLDVNTMRKIGVYVADDEGELTFLDEGGDTVLYRIDKPREGNEGVPDEGVEGMALDLGGELWIYEMRLEGIITDQIRSLQKLQNMAFTMLGRNVVTAGFLERIILNGEIPRRKIVDKVTGDVVEVQDDRFSVGPGVTTFLYGVEIENEAGELTYASPSVVYREPAPVDVFNATEAKAYSAMLNEANQSHVLMNQASAPSGKSREESRTDFERSISDSLVAVEATVGWIFTTLLRLVAALTNKRGRYDHLNVTVSVDIDLAAIAADIRRAIIEQVDAGLLSRETALGMLGVADVSGELDRIADERDEAELRQRTALASAFQRATFEPPSTEAVVDEVEVEDEVEA